MSQKPNDSAIIYKMLSPKLDKKIIYKESAKIEVLINNDELQKDSDLSMLDLYFAFLAMQKTVAYKAKPEIAKHVEEPFTMPTKYKRTFTMFPVSKMKRPNFCIALSEETDAHDGELEGGLLSGGKIIKDGFEHKLKHNTSLKVDEEPETHRWFFNKIGGLDRVIRFAVYDKLNEDCEFSMSSGKILEIEPTNKSYNAIFEALGEVKVSSKNWTPIPTISPESELVNYATSDKTLMIFGVDENKNLYTKLKSGEDKTVLLAYNLGESGRYHFISTMDKTIKLKDVEKYHKKSVSKKLSDMTSEFLKHVYISENDKVNVVFMKQEIKINPQYDDNQEESEDELITNEEDISMLEKPKDIIFETFFKDLTLYETVYFLWSHITLFGVSPIPKDDNKSDLIFYSLIDKSGTSQQRSALFFILADYLGIPCRFCNTDSHSFVEISDGKEWWCLDFGGVAQLPNPMISFNSFDEVYSYSNPYISNAEIPLDMPLDSRNKDYAQNLIELEIIYDKMGRKGDKIDTPEHWKEEGLVLSDSLKQHSIESDIKKIDKKLNKKQRKVI